MIKSLSFDQHEIIRWVQELYNPIDLDPTYGKGNFYPDKKPEYCFDINPKYGCNVIDYKQLPFACNYSQIKAIMFDPPFLATTGPSLKKEKGNIINKRFSVYSSEKELIEEYQKATKEMYRILAKGGFLYFKCQDKVSSGKQYFTHIDVYNMAVDAGFYPRDLFILGAKNRIVANWQREQQHARKFHCYFWVFEKKKYYP